jgi:hypothetical protein
MLTQHEPTSTDRASMNGHRTQDTAVSPSTITPRTGGPEGLRGPAGRLAAALIGIGLFGVSFTAFRLTDTPPEGMQGLLLEVAGWVGMLAAARIVTRRWLASSLVLTAWLLLVVGNSFGTRLIQRGTDRGLELGFNYVTALITLEAGVWLLVAVLMLDGAARLWREDTERLQARG